MFCFILLLNKKQDWNIYTKDTIVEADIMISNITVTVFIVHLFMHNVGVCCSQNWKKTCLSIAARSLLARYHAPWLALPVVRLVLSVMLVVTTCCQNIHSMYIIIFALHSIACQQIDTNIGGNMSFRLCNLGNLA